MDQANDANRSAYDPFISLIIPVLNEEDAIPFFLNRTSEILNAANLLFECVFVDDGSTDRTLDVLLEGVRNDMCIKVVKLSRNFGKEAALMAGIDHAKGEVLVPIDVDLQDPPELIPQFLALWREGYDIVYGMRADRQSDSHAKRVTASWFYRFFNRLSPVKIPENAGDFRLIDQKVAEALGKLPERNRFMKGLFAWVGFRSIGVPYDRLPRVAGATKWHYWSLWNFALDGLFSFSTLPLRVWTYLGGLIAGFAFVYAIFIVARTLISGIDVPGYASLITIVLFLGGIHLLSLGIIGEYLGRLFLEAKGRPLYLVEVVYDSNHDATADRAG